jgi:hypothetical protein
MEDQEKYIEQWERVKRWWTRVHEVSHGRSHVFDPDFGEDEIFAFFLNCYHLKDWIKNDSSSGDLKDLVEDYINKSLALSICADLCNGLKHLKRDSTRGKNAKFGPSTHQILDVNSSTIAITSTIVTDSGSFDAFEIASQCLVEWENFFHRNRKRAS